MLQYEKATWRQIFFLTILIGGYWVVQGINAIENKIEKLYYWIKYRNFDYKK